MLLNDVHLGDCLEVMKDIPDNTIDSIVTDPPYGTKFMGKKWDYMVPSVEKWEEILRVLKPGGYLLSFGGCRTYHRLVCNVEDAGFEIRDQLQWVFGSGFPKGQNISRGIDKMFGVLKAEEADQLEGWNTALKPAHESIVLARKPISEKTTIENVLKWGTGGLNIDECRIRTKDKWKASGKQSAKSISLQGGKDGSLNISVSSTHDKGRWPANIIHDGSDEVLDLFEAFGTNKGQQADLKGTEPSRKTSTCYGEYERQGVFKKRNDSGSAARFFYCSKASKSERGEGNKHPTVKPIALLKYLIKLITPKGGVVLDPFIGSGSTAIAAKELGFNWIGVEKEEDSYGIAKKRIKNYFKCKNNGS